MIEIGEETQEIVQEELESIIKTLGWKKQMEYLYRYSCNNGYIQEERLKLNVNYPKFYHKNYENIPFEITINCSKPEIIAGVKTQSSNYLNFEGECVICYENIGSEKRKGLRCYEFNCNGKEFFRQFPPYPYFNFHNIIVDKKHTPQVLTRDTIKELLLITQQMPGYKVASNSDREGTGVTNLAHRHYQAGDHSFPVYLANVKKEFQCTELNTIIQWLNYPCCCLKIIGTNLEQVEETIHRLFKTWKEGSFPSLINNLQTCSMISTYHQSSKSWEFLYFPRNAEQPRFLTRPTLQCIKKEFVGIFELCGFAVLPSRLKQQLLELEEYFKTNINGIKEELIENLPNHLEIFKDWLKEYYIYNNLSDGDDDIKSKLELSLKQSFIDILSDNTPISIENIELVEDLITQSNLK